MFDLIVGFIVGLVILTGLAIIVGPATLSRIPGLSWMNRGQARDENGSPSSIPETSSPVLHPSTQRAMVSAVRLAGALAEAGHEKHAETFQEAARQLPHQETEGLLRIHAACRLLRRQAGPLPPRLDRQLERLEATVADRCEQLELIPYL